MAAVAIEGLYDWPTRSVESIVTVLQRQDIIDVSSLPSDELVKKRADRLIRYAGELAVNASKENVKALEKPDNNLTLFDALHAARQGDEKATKMVHTNVHTDFFERSIKAGFVLSVDLDVDESGRISQHGQSNEQIQVNTLSLLSGNQKMLPRFHAETRNMFRLENALREGLLEEYNFVVFSLCADDMNDEELAAAGFFVPTKSMAIQSSSLNQTGGITTESAFVAGITQDSDKRHDAEMLSSFGKKHGIKLEGTASKIIDTPCLIHKSLMPNGVVDIVEMLDESKGTFFGENKLKKDYLQFRHDCREREREMAPMVDKITKKLLEQSSSIDSPIAAVKLLDKISGDELTKYALVDDRIDVRVFGEMAAWYLTDARAHLASGDSDRVRLALSYARETQKSSSCPSGAKNNDSELDSISDETDEGGQKKSTEVIDDCEFVSKECPKCHEKNVKTTVKNGKYYGACGCIG